MEAENRDYSLINYFVLGELERLKRKSKINEDIDFVKRFESYLSKNDSLKQYFERDEKGNYIQKKSCGSYLACNNYHMDKKVENSVIIGNPDITANSRVYDSLVVTNDDKTTSISTESRVLNSLIMNSRVNNGSYVQTYSCINESTIEDGSKIIGPRVYVKNSRIKHSTLKEDREIVDSYINDNNYIEPIVTTGNANLRAFHSANKVKGLKTFRGTIPGDNGLTPTELSPRSQKDNTRGQTPQDRRGCGCTIL